MNLSALLLFLRRHASCDPADAMDLASANGLRLVPSLQPGSCLTGNSIRYDARASHSAQQELVATELARWTLHGAPINGGVSAVELAAAILRPVSSSRLRALTPYALRS